MVNKTIFRDNLKTECREAWQNGEKIYDWSKREIDTMHNEVPHVVPVWGEFGMDIAVKRGRRNKPPNAKNEGLA